MSAAPNLFDDKFKVKMGYWDYKNLPVGSRIQGTLIAKRAVPDNFHPGQDQAVYDLRIESGDVISVFGKASIDSRMKAIRLGQIVAMEYKGEFASKKPGMKAAKVVEVYADPKLVDEDWLKEQEELSTEKEIQEGAESFGGHVIPDFNEPTAPVAPAGDDKHAAILKLALEKVPGANAENYKKMVANATGVAYLDMNLDKIITALS
jgi:hypothetical protein